MQVAEINSSRGSPTIGDRRRGTDGRSFDSPGYTGPERRMGAGRGPTKTPARSEDLLEPRNGNHFLVVPVILFRVQQSFAYMEADEEVGRLHVEQLKEDIRANIHNVIEKTRRLENLQEVQNHAVYVRWGDSPASEMEYLSAVLIPGEAIRVNYESTRHKESSRPLLERFASILDYQIVGEGTAGE